MNMFFYLYAIILLSTCASGSVNFVDFEKIGGIPGNNSYDAQWWNFNLLNTTLSSLAPSSTLFFPNATFHLIGGIKARHLRQITFLVDGTLVFSDDRAVWPVKADGKVEECIYIEHSSDLVFTSSGTGTFDGNGKKWWGSIKYLKNAGDRPRLIHLNMTTNVLVERLLLKNSPFWTFYAEHSFGLVIRHTDVSARWTDLDEHTPLDLQAYNTDGFDVSGKHVHIHDCNIWNQDDCIAVKSNSEHMLFERISCSGLGLVIGSIGNAKVDNITFRDCVMPRTFKGIYMKTRWNDSGPVFGEASISNILYQNITMDRPQQYPIWIGPAQQTGQPCDLRWPQGPNAECRMSGYQTWKNIVLRDIFINNPDNSPGVLLSNASNPMHGVVFDNVVVTSPGMEPFGPNYYCEATLYLEIMSGTDTSDSILLVLDVPSGVEFGIDCITYETGPKFKGLSLVPTGLHFVYHGTGMGARQGFFIMVGNKDIHVKRWDSSQEEIMPRIDLSESSLRNLHHSLAIGELNEFLGPYPLQQHHTWKNITNFISVDVLDRADCSLCSLLYPGDDSDVLVLERTPAQTTRNKHGGHSSEAVKPYFPDSARIARFSDLQMIEMELIESLPAGPQRASTVTAMMMDKSTLVEHMIAHIHQGSWSQFLGEIQLSFVLFMVLYSYPALKQWKLFVYSVCSSERLLQANQPFTSAFLRMLFGQLNFAPADFFENELSTQNFLRPTITALFSALSGPGLNPTLLEHKKRLRTFLQKKFNLHETEPFESVDASTGMQVTYEEEDFYNIAEEDLPTFVSEEEVRSYLGNDGTSGNGSTLGTRGANIGMAVDFDGMEDMRLNARDTAPNVFKVRTGHGNMLTQSSGSHSSDAPGEMSTEGFHQRWADIDSALGQAPQVSGAGSGLLGADLLASHTAQTSTQRAAQDSRNYTFGMTTTDAPIAPSAPSASVQSVVEKAMTPAEQEAALFSWRYPLVYESMLLAQGREDMVMAAMRILEEGNITTSGLNAHTMEGEIALGNTVSSDLSCLRYKEAERFVEYELGTRS